MDNAQQSSRKKSGRIISFLGNLILVSIATFAILIITEFILTRGGFNPGFIARYDAQQFKFVEELIVRQEFITDEEGIFKVNNDYQGFKYYTINSDGFRGRELTPTDEGPSVLFIGDSFTWGASARPISQGFVDLVDRTGVIAYNLGIPGTGPAQYEILAEKYIPILKPDFVALMLYPGNDFVSPLPNLPNQNLYHITNAGWISAYDEVGTYLDPEKAYAHYQSRNNRIYQSAECQKRLGYQLFTKSVTGTYLWYFFALLKNTLLPFLHPECHLQNPDDWPQPFTHKDIVEMVQTSIHNIDRLAQENNGKLLIFVIPLHPDLVTIKRSYLAPFRDALNEFQVFTPDDLTVDDYMELPNDHWNNRGHQKMADYLTRILNEEIN